MSDFEDPNEEPIRIPTYNIMARERALAVERSDNANPSVAHQYAITINVDPHHKINNRRWSKYSNDKQIAILTRIERSCRDLLEECRLIKLVFEQCPSSKQIHFHALYSMSESTKVSYMKYMGKRLERSNAPSWRWFDCLPCVSLEAWLKYISKAPIKVISS